MQPEPASRDPLDEHEIAARVRALHRRSHTARTTPAALERWLEDHGFCLRLLSAEDMVASQVAAEGVYPIDDSFMSEVENSLVGEKEGKKAWEEIKADLSRCRFRRLEDGTWRRGDVLIYVQLVEERDEIRVERRVEMELLGDPDVVYNQLGDAAGAFVKDAAKAGHQVRPPIDPEIPGQQVPHARDHVVPPSRLQRMAKEAEEKSGKSKRGRARR